MTKDRDYDEIPTVAEAKQQRKDRIHQLWNGNKGDRRLAALVSKCRRDKRCHLDVCPVCERRRRKAAQQVPVTLADVVKVTGKIIGVIEDEISTIERTLEEELGNLFRDINHISDILALMPKNGDASIIPADGGNPVSAEVIFQEDNSPAIQT
jgi:hypothetical protein